MSTALLERPAEAPVEVEVAHMYCPVCQPITVSAERATVAFCGYVRTPAPARRPPEGAPKCPTCVEMARPGQTYCPRCDTLHMWVGRLP